MTRPAKPAATATAATAPTAAKQPLPTSGRFRPEAPGRNPVRSGTVPTADIRIAGPADGPAIAGLRRQWTAEQHGEVADDGYEARFLDWYARESDHRVNWLGEVGGRPVGMMNLVIFERMPRPGLDSGTWGYLANAFVLGPHRNQGIGALLLAAVIAYADDHQYVRIVLRPSERAVPFYERAGFFPDGGFMVRSGERS